MWHEVCPVRCLRIGLNLPRFRSKTAAEGTCGGCGGRHIGRHQVCAVLGAGRLGAGGVVGGGGCAAAAPAGGRRARRSPGNHGSAFAAAVAIHDTGACGPGARRAVGASARPRRRRAGAAHPDRPLRPRCPGPDHERADVAHLPGAARSGRHLPRPQGGQVRKPGGSAASRRLCGACQLRARQRRQGAPSQGGHPRGVRPSGRRHASSKAGSATSRFPRPDHLRHLQGQPVRARLQAAAGAGRDHRRRRGGAGGQLSHRLELRRHQRGGALRHPGARPASSPT